MVLKITGFNLLEVQGQCLSPELEFRMEISQPKVQIYKLSLNQYREPGSFFSVGTFNLAEIIINRFLAKGNILLKVKNN